MHGMRFIAGFEDLFLGVDAFGNSCWINSEPLMYQNYLQYLSDARGIISTSVQACQVWSAPYDGLNPSPDEHQGEEEEVQDGDRYEDECPPLTTPPLQPPSLHHTSLSQTPELEWDDSYDAAPDGPENQNFKVVEHLQPPQHIQDMRKSAIMLIRGSYIEESEFQDDVLVYNLIAQRDAQDEQVASLRSPNDNTIQTETNNNTQLFTSSSTHKIQHHNQQSEEASFLLNGNADEKKTDQLNDKSTHVDRSKSMVLEVFSQDVSNISSVERTGEDFISQCLQLIEWDNESILGDNVYFQRLTALLYDEEPEIDFNSLCADDEEDDDERDEVAEQKHSDGKKHVPFTGEVFFLFKQKEGQLNNCLMLSCRPFHQCAALSPGEHAGEFCGGEPAGDGNPGSAGSISTAPTALLPTQHTSHLPNQRPLSLPGL